MSIETKNLVCYLRIEYIFVNIKKTLLSSSFLCLEYLKYISSICIYKIISVSDFQN